MLWCSVITGRVLSEGMDGREGGMCSGEEGWTGRKEVEAGGEEMMEMWMRQDDEKEER